MLIEKINCRIHQVKYTGIFRGVIRRIDNKIKYISLSFKEDNNDKIEIEIYRYEDRFSHAVFLSEIYWTEQIFPNNGIFNKYGKWEIKEQFEKYIKISPEEGEILCRSVENYLDEIYKDNLAMVRITPTTIRLKINEHCLLPLKKTPRKCY